MGWVGDGEWGGWKGMGVGEGWGMEDKKLTPMRHMTMDTITAIDRGLGCFGWRQNETHGARKEWGRGGGWVGCEEVWMGSVDIEQTQRQRLP